MGMGKFGLLQGLGVGVASSGDMIMKDRLDQMKEQRLQAYQDKIRKEDQGIRAQERTEDRTFAEQQELRGMAERTQNRLLDQQNVDRQFEFNEKQFDRSEEQFELNKSLVNKQIERIGQEIDISGMELTRQRDIQKVWDQIQEADDSDQDTLNALFDRYRRLTGTDKDDRFSFHAIPEFDEITGNRTGTTLYTHNSRTNQVSPYAGGNAQESPEQRLERLLQGLQRDAQGGEGGGQSGGSASTNAPVRQPDPYSMGAIAQERGDTGAAERAAGLLRRITPNLQPEGQIAQIEDRINMVLSRSGGSPSNNRQLDEQRLALTRLIQSPDTPEEIRDQARQLFDRIR
jgi:hypothetical protein